MEFLNRKGCGAYNAKHGVAKSSNWIKGATSHTIDQEVCMCDNYGGYSIKAFLLLIVWGMAISLFIYFYKDTCLSFFR